MFGMRLTLYTDYALRLLMYLAATDPMRRATIAEVAETYGIAKNHLTKVAYELSTRGLMKTTRGKGGGLGLARAPQDISLGEVVRATEPDMALVPCMDPVCAHCVIVPACELRRVLEQARTAFLAVLDRYTLAELTSRRVELHALLWPSAPVPGTG
jgi:Rrf2 family transcriptional regulator, nitric oxide-sensitive transcriptional repressor